MPAVQETVDQVRRIDVDQYKYGFETLIESDKAPKGLSEDIVRFISAKKNEPEWMLAWRLDAYRRWLTMREPTWARVTHPPIDYQSSTTTPRRRRRTGRSRSTRSTPRSCSTYEKLGIPLREVAVLEGVQKPVAEDDGEGGTGAGAATPASPSTRCSTRSRSPPPSRPSSPSRVIFMPISEALQKHPELVKKYLGTVVPVSDNFFATLKLGGVLRRLLRLRAGGRALPMELSTYFRINERNTGQFERTLIIADKGSYVSYLEGCTAPMRDETSLHAAVVELIALDDAEIKYSTIQNWYPGDANGRGGVYNFRHQARRLPRQELEDLLDPARDRLRHHLEISELHPARR
jgi:Fe-S cluster assembly protein SufB